MSARTNAPTSRTIREYDIVRVRSLDGVRADEFGLGCRSPAIGELGAVVSILSADGQDDASLIESVLVECVSRNATTLWIASFPASSLDVVSAIDSATDSATEAVPR
jgi:hypothetical protein